MVERPQFSFSGPVTKGGGGKGRATKKKNLFWNKKNKKINPITTKLEGGGGLSGPKGLGH